MINRIVTRGFGPSRGAAGRAGPVTMGYGGIGGAIIVEIKPPEPRRRPGRTRPEERRDEEVLVRVRLFSINDASPDEEIKGSVRINKSQGGTPHVVIERMDHGSTSTSERVKVTVKLVR